MFTSVRRLGKITSTAVKYGFGPFFGQDAKDAEPSPVRLRKMLEELGPTAVKVGQTLATRPDMIPPDYISELRKLQDDVDPLPFHLLRGQIEESLDRPLAEVFAEFEATPLAAGSIAQVHKARLTTGEKVAVKVQRPGIEKVIEEDIGLLEQVALIIEESWDEAAVYSPRETANEFAQMIRRELDFTQEARNISRFERNFADHRGIRGPRVFPQFTSKQLLVMEFIEGIKADDLERLRSKGIDTRRVVELGAEANMRGLLVHGMFHADPHPGNIMVQPDGTIVFLDFGAVGRITRERRDLMIDLFMAIGQRDTDATATTVLRLCGRELDSINVTDFHQDIDDLIDHFHGELIKGDLPPLLRLSQDHRMALPSDLVLLERAILQIGHLAKRLSPGFTVLNTIIPIIEEQVALMALRRQVGQLAPYIMGKVNTLEELRHTTKVVEKLAGLAKLENLEKLETLPETFDRWERTEKKYDHYMKSLLLVVGSAAVTVAGAIVRLEEMMLGLGLLAVGIVGTIFSIVYGFGARKRIPEGDPEE